MTATATIIRPTESRRALSSLSPAENACQILSIAIAIIATAIAASNPAASAYIAADTSESCSIVFMCRPASHGSNSWQPFTASAARYTAGAGARHAKGGWPAAPCRGGYGRRGTSPGRRRAVHACGLRMAGWRTDATTIGKIERCQ